MKIEIEIPDNINKGYKYAIQIFKEKLYEDMNPTMQNKLQLAIAKEVFIKNSIEQIKAVIEGESPFNYNSYLYDYVEDEISDAQKKEKYERKHSD